MNVLVSDTTLTRVVTYFFQIIIGISVVSGTHMCRCYIGSHYRSIVL